MIIGKLILMYVIAFIIDFTIFQLLKIFFEDENITTRNNLKISLLLSLITVVVALIKGV